MSRTARRQALTARSNRRHAVTRAWLADHAGDLAARLRETRALFGEPVVLVDPHTHSEYRDGACPPPRATVSSSPAGRPRRRQLRRSTSP